MSSAWSFASRPRWGTSVLRLPKVPTPRKKFCRRPCV